MMFFDMGCLVDTPGKRFRAQPDVIIEFLVADRFQGAGRHFRHQGQDMRPAVKREPAGMGCKRITPGLRIELFRVGVRAVDKVNALAGQAGKAGIEGRVHRQQDQTGVQIGLIKRVVVNIGRQIAGRGNEPAFGQCVEQGRIVLHIASVLDGVPVVVPDHVVIGFGDGDTLGYLLSSIGDQSVLERVGSGQAGIADEHELGQVMPDIDAGRRPAKGVLGIDPAIGAADARTAGSAGRIVGERIQAVYRGLYPRIAGSRAQVGQWLVAQQRQLVDLRHLVGQFRGAERRCRRHGDGLGVRALQVIDSTGGRGLPFAAFLTRIGNGHLQGESVYEPFVDGMSKSLEMRRIGNKTGVLVVVQALGETHRVVSRGKSLFVAIGHVGHVRAMPGPFGCVYAYAEGSLSSVGWHDRSQISINVNPASLAPLLPSARRKSAARTGGSAIMSNDAS